MLYSNNDVQKFVLEKKKSPYNSNEFSLIYNFEPTSHVTLNIDNPKFFQIYVRAIITHTRNTRVIVSRVLSSEPVVTIDARFAKKFFRVEFIVSTEIYTDISPECNIIIY